MCRLFGMSAGRNRMQATFWLLDAPDSLTAQSRHNPDGTGLGYFDDDGRPVVRKAPIAAYEDRDFATEARSVSSRTFVAHVRFASAGGRTVADTHPFEQDGRLFAHNGVVGDLPRLDDELGDAQSLVQGETDSERVFALVTREIRRSDGDVPGGIATAIRWIAANLPVFSANLVLTTESELFALRYPDTHELYVLERDAGGHHGREALKQQSHLGSAVHAQEAAECPVVVIASERLDDDPGWQLLEPGELVRVTADLEVRRDVVLRDPPAHPLTLADLTEHERSSQTPGAARPGGGSS